MSCNSQAMLFTYFTWPYFIDLAVLSVYMIWSTSKRFEKHGNQHLLSAYYVPGTLLAYVISFCFYNKHIMQVRKLGLN